MGPHELSPEHDLRIGGSAVEVVDASDPAHETISGGQWTLRHQRCPDFSMAS
jgi:hypothetical protein